MCDDPQLKPGSSPARSPHDDPTRSLVPAGEGGGVIGPYRLLQTLGEGGMGEVWLAEQTEPIRRQVALKVIKAGMDTKQIVGRFEAERQALALMNHPSIAKVFDAGATPRGLPFFAMEYIKGEAITTYCNRQKMKTHDRLELFMQVCDGVQHAHQKGIIHRDLKPSNVLVTIQDGKPVPKIIDFGVAKATAQRLTEKTVFTELGVLIGTPEYMSPEQAEMTGLDVDTRTDVYALGMILYELLVGALPFDIRGLRNAGFDEIRRRIRDVEPQRPSARVSTLGEDSIESARQRGTEPARLASALKGDLDWIVIKALEKDRTRRYGSPAELAADIKRHLLDEPVLAGPPSAAYRTRKFVRRHKFGVAAAALGFVVPVTFGVAMAVQARRIAREAEAKGRVAEFLQELFQVTNPDKARGNNITARELLDRGAKRIRDALSDDPQVHADLMATMGVAYTNLGVYEEAEPLLQDALETRTRVLGPDASESLRLAHELSRLYRLEGRYPEAEALSLQTLAVQKRILGPGHPDTLRSMSNLAEVYQMQGRNKDSEALIGETVAAQKRVLGPDHPDTLQSMNTLGTVYYYEGRYQEAEVLIRKAFETRKRVLGPDHPSTLLSMGNLGSALFALGRVKECDALYGEALDYETRVLGSDHPTTLVTRTNLAARYADQGRFQEAEKLEREVLDIRMRILGPENPDTRVSVQNVAEYCRKQGRFQEAEALDRENLAILKRVLGPEHPDTLQSQHSVALDLQSQARYRESEPMNRETLATRKRVLGPEHPETLWSMTNLAVDCRALGRYQESEGLDREVLEVRKRILGSEHPDTLQSQHNLAIDYQDQARYEESEPLNRATYDARKRVLGADDPGTIWSMSNLGDDLIRLHRYKEAETIEQEALAARRRILGSEHPDTLLSMRALGYAYLGEGRLNDAEPVIRQALEIEKRALGPGDLKTIASTYDLGCIKARQGDRVAALRYLRDAVQHGPFTPKSLMEDPDLVSLRGDPEFRSIVAMAHKNERGQ